MTERVVKPTLREAVDMVMAHQWSNTREAMDALQQLIDAALYGQETVDSLLSDIRGLCNLSRKLLAVAPKNPDAFYLERLLRHCNEKYGA